MAEIKVVELQVKTNLDNANVGINKLKTNLKDVSTQAKETTESVSGMSKVEGTINAIGDGVGKLNPAFGAAVKGANGLILKMWEMVANPVGAILAGIVITAKFLYEAFQSSVAGGKELKTIFAGISAVGTQVKDAIFGLGRALISTATAAYKFITLDFAGAAEDMKKANGEATESYKQLGNAVDGTTFKIVKNLEKQQQANDKARKVQAVVQSETNKLLVQSREILTDETASIKDKKKALEEVTKAEKESSAEKVRIAKVDLDIIKAKAKALGGEEEKKAKVAIREATIALNEAETENAMTGIKLNKQRKMLVRQEVSDAKAAADELKTINEEKATKAKEAYDADKLALEEKLKEEGLNFQQRRDLIKADLILNAKDRKKLNDEINKEEKKSIEEHLKAITDLENKYKTAAEDRAAVTALQKLDLERKRAEEEINNIAKTEEEKAKLKLLLNADYNAKLKIINDTAEKEKAAAEDANFKARLEIDKLEYEHKRKMLGATTALLDTASGALGDSTVAGKAAAVASATIKTLLASVDAFQGMVSAIPGPAGVAAGIAASGFAVLSGFKTVKGILAVKTPKGSGGGGATPSTPSAMGGAPQFNVVGNTGANQLAQSMANQNAQPLQAYVVSGAVTSAQSLDRNIISNASIG